MLVRRYVQRVGNAEMMPQKLVQCGIFVNPDNFLYGYDGNAVVGKHNKIMLCDKHIFRCQLWQGGKFFFCLCKQRRWFAEKPELTAGGREYRQADIQNIQEQPEQGICASYKIDTY